jgi:hypothetical protein
VPHDSNDVINELNRFAGKGEDHHRARADPRKALDANDAALMVCLGGFDAWNSALRVLSGFVSKELCVKHAQISAEAPHLLS